MVSLVVNKSYKKNKKNHIKSLARKIKIVYPKINFSVKNFWWIISVIIFISGILFVIKNTIFRAENYIVNVAYSRESIEKYDNPYLYKFIGDILKGSSDENDGTDSKKSKYEKKNIKGKNIYVISKLKKSELLSNVKSEFPMVKNLKIVKSGPYSVSVWIDFYEPEIIINLGNKQFAIVGSNDFELYSGNTLGQGVLSVDLPQYASGITSLYGLFHEIDKDQFMHDMKFLVDSFPESERIVYLPGAAMTAILLPGSKRVYINNQNSLQEQIDNFYMIKEFYPDFNSLNIIDLGSLQGGKIIVQ